MYINDDADGATIAKDTVAAANECARMVGKIGPTFTDQELADMEKAGRLLLNAIAMKMRTNNASGS